MSWVQQLLNKILCQLLRNRRYYYLQLIPGLFMPLFAWQQKQELGALFITFISCGHWPTYLILYRPDSVPKAGYNSGVHICPYSWELVWSEGRCHVVSRDVSQICCINVSWDVDLLVCFILEIKNTTTNKLNLLSNVTSHAGYFNINFVICICGDICMRQNRIALIFITVPVTLYLVCLLICLTNYEYSCTEKFITLMYRPECLPANGMEQSPS
jgi:hypothetical protein